MDTAREFVDRIKADRDVKHGSLMYLAVSPERTRRRITMMHVADLLNDSGSEFTVPEGAESAYRFELPNDIVVEFRTVADGVPAGGVDGIWFYGAAQASHKAYEEFRSRLTAFDSWWLEDAGPAPKRENASDEVKAADEAILTAKASATVAAGATALLHRKMMDLGLTGVEQYARHTAQAQKHYFDACIAAGFTEQQAMQLTIAWNLPGQAEAHSKTPFVPLVPGLEFQ